MGPEREKYPAIRLTGAEKQRKEELRAIGREFQKGMDEQGNPCALKGGTAMRVGMKLPRPSTDLDFEGEQQVAVRKTVQTAVARALPGRNHQVGRNWLLRGAVRITNPNTRSQASVDYRVLGSRPGMPDRIDESKCRRTDGLKLYNDKELVERKLQTIVGSAPRRKPRDLYDAGWIVHEHPELVPRGRSVVHRRPPTTPTGREGTRR